jgi:hypothetical protein
VDEVTHTDGVAVTVAAGDHYFEVRVGEFDTRADRQRAAVDTVERVAVHVGADLSGTADPGDHEGVIGVVAGVGECFHHAVHRPEVTAAGTPSRLFVGFEIRESNV